MAVGRADWGRGYAPEAARAAMDWARDALGADHLVSLIEDRNRASQRVAEKLGMTLEGRTRIRNGQIEVRVFGIDLGVKGAACYAARVAGTNNQ